MRVIDGVGGSARPCRMPQERSSRGGRSLGIPLFEHALVSEAIASLNICARSKTMWTLPPLWTHRTRPTGVWKSRTEREIPTASTSIIVFSKEKEERRTQPLRSNCPRNRISPTRVARIRDQLPLYRRFDAEASTLGATRAWGAPFYHPSTVRYRDNSDDIQPDGRLARGSNQQAAIRVSSSRSEGLHGVRASPGVFFMH